MRDFSISAAPYNSGDIVFTKSMAGNRDIIKTIEKAFPGATEQTKNIANNFRGKNTLDTSSNIWYWLKSNIDFKKDNDYYQVVKYPSKLLSDKFSDCKSLALFTAAILKNLNIPFVFRYINQDGDNIPKHVYVVAIDETGEPVYIDAVHTKFNEQPPHIKFLKDYNYNTMKVSAIAGLRTPKEHTYKNFLNEKIAGVYGIGDFFDQIADQATYLGADVVAPGSGEVLRATGGATGQTPSSFVKKLNPFGAPAVSNKKDELLVMSSPNSNNLFRKLYTGFRLQNQNGNTISNAYAFEHIIPDTEAGLKQGGLTGDYAKWDFHQYTVNDIYNKVGGDWDKFLANLKSKYGNNDIVVNGVQYLWEVNAFVDLFKTYGGNIDNFINQFGGTTQSTQESPAGNPNNQKAPAGNNTHGGAPTDSIFTTQNIVYGILGLGIIGGIIYAVKK